jgi:uncharacterized protein (DUF1778 family)
MAAKRRRRRSSPVVVRLDRAKKAILAKAAKLHGMSLSAYVQKSAIAQAEREVGAPRGTTIGLSADEGLAFWNALNDSGTLTPAQRELGALMREATGDY